MHTMQVPSSNSCLQTHHDTVGFDIRTRYIQARPSLYYMRILLTQVKELGIRYAIYIYRLTVYKHLLQLFTYMKIKRAHLSQHIQTLGETLGKHMCVSRSSKEAKLPSCTCTCVCGQLWELALVHIFKSSFVPWKLSIPIQHVHYRRKCTEAAIKFFNCENPSKCVKWYEIVMSCFSSSVVTLRCSNATKTGFAWT